MATGWRWPGSRRPPDDTELRLGLPREMSRTVWRAAAPPRTRDPSRGSTRHGNLFAQSADAQSAVPPSSGRSGHSPRARRCISRAVLTLGSGDGPLSVRRHPSTVNGASRFLRKWPSTTIDRGASVPPPARRPRVRQEPARTGRGPSPARCGNLSQFSHKLTGRYRTTASMSARWQDADLRIRIPAHWPDGGIDLRMLPCLRARLGGHAGRHEPAGREADLCTHLCTRRGGTC